ncbi:ABC transporter permease [Bacillus sp. 31A1R]|uniref:ABC transporter permease n=1 Tax=Robertmurraya mangrovi TaxID=3098077 RepID=A0ABU5ISU1_9BACI|nr:ABC transporter permease [Bacillus sp. 31A1R]MDZ5470213.1 ABC transporter permease [Bacillus sp. 31A1R]
MFDANKLWKERLGTASKELGKYFRYIFNGHIVIVLVFLLGTVAFYYQEWVKTLTPEFPAAILMALFLAVLLTYSPIYSFLKEADKIFLLPLENRLEPYFKSSIILSFFIQVYFLVLGLGVFMPIYAQVNNGDFGSFFMFLLSLCAVKFINILIKWRVQYYVEVNVHLVDSLIRYCLNGVFLFLLFSNAGYLFLGLIFVIYLCLYLYYRSQTMLKGLKWEFLIEQEERRMMSFYRLANLFTDVPKLKDRVKRRKWLDFISASIPYKQDQTFLHLFVNTFIRGGDYLGLFVRLTVIGGLGLYLVTFGYGQILFVILFLYLTGFQLLPLWNHHQNKLWIQLYPVKDKIKGQSFQKLMVRLLGAQVILLSIPLFLKGEWVIAGLSIIAGMLFSFFFVFVYSKNKLQI